jgi:hypothetical protein
MVLSMDFTKFIKKTMSTRKGKRLSSNWEPKFMKKFISQYKIKRA